MEEARDLAQFTQPEKAKSRVNIGVLTPGLVFKYFIVVSRSVVSNSLWTRSYMLQWRVRILQLKMLCDATKTQHSQINKNWNSELNSLCHCLKNREHFPGLQWIPGEGDNRGWDGWMASWTRWTWVWVNSGSWWWTGRPGVLQLMGSQRVRHTWVTELNWYLPKVRKETL